jgi:hypothetical protein
MYRLDLDDLMKVWHEYGERATWKDVQARARAAGDERMAGIAERAVADVRDVGPLEALAANRRLVELLISRRWYVMREAREAGHSWADIGDVLGVTPEEARDWYRSAIARQADHVGDLHDAERARRAL